MASHELTLKNYHKQLKDNIKLIYENYMDLLRTKTEHVNFEVQVKSAEIVRSYQSLMQLVSEIRVFLIINDLVGLNQPSSIGQSNVNLSQQADPTSHAASQSQHPEERSADLDERLIRLRDEMSMFLYELEIPLP